MFLSRQLFWGTVSFSREENRNTSAASLLPPSAVSRYTGELQVRLLAFLISLLYFYTFQVYQVLFFFKIMKNA